MARFPPTDINNEEKLNSPEFVASNSSLISFSLLFKTFSFDVEVILSSCLIKALVLSQSLALKAQYSVKDLLLFRNLESQQVLQ